ncbi:MAG: hypothetical protein RLZZ603_1559, partial [Actinomycetota bacterium]
MQVSWNILEEDVVKSRTPKTKELVMPVAFDPSASLTEYAHPEALVTTEWLAANLGTDGLVVLESDEDVLLYETGHIPTARKIDWFTE